MKTSRNKMLRRKNEVLRQKIKEVCGTAGVWSSERLDPELENQFLKNVLAFEQQYKKRKRIRVIDKIGIPLNLRPVSAIPEPEVDSEWLKLHDCMRENGIDLQVRSPGVGARELYRFATEELFKMKIDDISIPGMMTCFIYDEFYPNRV